MKVDRSLFLLLTGALAGGCHVYIDEPPSRTARPPAPPPQAHAAPAAPPPSAAPPPAAPPPTKPPVQQAVAPHLPPLRGVVVAPANSGGNAPPASPAAPTCLDSNAATVPDCATMKAPDTTCAPFPFPQQECSTYKTYFDPKVAAQAISCMASLSSKQVCDATQTYGCGKAALAQACPDAALAQLCSIATTACKSTQADCMSLLSGLNDHGQQQVAACIAQGCQSGLYSCVEGLR